jgi:Protein of unknown function (DUF3306)
MSAREPPPQDDGFLGRWSRRKREAAEQQAEPKPPEPARGSDATSTAAADGAASARPDVGPGAGTPAPVDPKSAFDPKSLPSIEQITATTDIRGFLAPGVPAELAQAALRRVWTTDPAIRDFIGPADYAWDYNAPGAMLGFGPLNMTEALRQEVLRMLGQADSAAPGAPPAVEQAAEPPSAPAATPLPAASSRAVSSQEELAPKQTIAPAPGSLAEQTPEFAAVQYRPDTPPDADAIIRRGHGRALPK